MPAAERAAQCKSPVRLALPSNRAMGAASSQSTRAASTDEKSEMIVSTRASVR